jgi:hypothetical protein
MAAVSPLTLIFQAVDQASPVVRSLIGDLKKNFEVVTSLSFAYNQVTQTIQQFAAQGQKAYSLLIGQNTELQQQLLATQASLVATNKVISQGVEITDPTKAIQALTEPVNQAVAKLRQGSLELVGVTSAQLVPLFQLIAGQSANIGASLDDSSKLALDFAAALGTTNIPLNAANQEINSILTAQITSDSQLAKNIGLNNQQVNQYKAQGILVQELTKRLSAFRAGNALAAQTIEGISSNLAEVRDEIFRVAGAPLLQPIVTQLNTLYNFLIDNKDLIQSIATDTVNFFLDIGTKIGDAVTTLEPALSKLFGNLFVETSAEIGAAAAVINLLVDGFVALLKASEPLIQILANITSVLAKFSSSDIGGLVLQATLLTGLLAQFAPLLIAIQAGFIKAAAGAILFGSAASGSTSALLVLRTVAPTLAAIAASYAAAGGGAIGFAAALGTTTASIQAFGVSAAAALAPLLPLIALGGAIAVSLTIKQTGDLRVANEELEEFRQQNEILGDQSIGLATKLKSLNDVERANGKLTEEETKRRKALQQITVSQVDALKSQIAAIKEIQPASEEQTRTQQAQVAELQKQVDLLNKLSGGTKLSAKDVQILGNDYQQLAKKVADAQSQFNSFGGGDSERFKQAGKELVGLTQQQVELGQLTEQQAIAQLDKIRNNTSLDLEIRRQAQQEIEKIRQGGVDQETQILQNQQQKIQALIASEGISQAEGQRRITESRAKELQIQLDAVRSAIAAENALRKTQVDAQVAAINTQITEAQKRLAEAQGKGDLGGARIAGEDIAKLESQRRAAQASLGIDSDRQSQLKVQEQKFSTEIAQTQAQGRQQARAEALKDYDEQQSILDSQNAQRLITEQEFNQRSLSITKARGEAELKQLAEQRAKLPTSDREGQEAIASRESAIRKKIAEDTEKFEQQKSQTRIATVDAEQRILAASLAEGQVSQQEYNQQSLALTQQRLQLELDEVNRQRDELKAGDTKRLNELNASEADIRKRSVDAIASNQEQQVQLIEQAQRRATDIVSQSESDRLLEITRLEATQTINKVEAEKLRADAAGDRIKEELRLEKEKLAELEALPPFSDPAKEEQRQGQIRASRLQTSRITKSLIDNEVQQRDAAFRIVEDRLNKEIQQIQNNATAQNQALERQQQLQGFISRSLDNQIKLLEARKNLVSSVAGFFEGELNVLKETTKNQREQKRLGETAAEIRLNSARAAFEIEREITKQKQEQRDIELAIKELQLVGEQASASSATLKAQAEQKKVEERPGATQGEKDAAALDVTAAIAREFEVQIKGALLGQERAIAATQGQQELGDLARTQQLQDDQNRLALANSRVSKGRGRRELRELRGDILSREGVASTRDFGKGLNFGALGGGILAQLAQLQSAIGGALPTGAIQQTTQMLKPGALAQLPANAKMGEALQMLATQKAPVGTVNITVNNEFAGQDATNGKAADVFTQKIRKELFDLGTLLTR